MNFLKTTAAAVLILASSVIASQASTLQEIKDSTYKLYLGEEMYCTAEFVTPDILLTAAHCIPPNVRTDSGYNIKVDGKVYFLTVNEVNHDTDTAVLSVVTPHKPFSFVDVAPKDTTVPFGTEVWTVGYPNDMEEMVTSGLISSVTSIPNFEGGNPVVWKTNVDIAPGSSGGGLYEKRADGEYELIGTASATWAQYPWMTYFSTIGGVYEVLKGYGQF